MANLKIALLVDNRSLNEWEERSLAAISDMVEVVLVINCVNTVTKKRILSNWAYYALNLISIRSSLTKKKRHDFQGCKILDFSSRYEGAWQWIPESVVEEIITSGAQVVIKFGMSLLKTDNLGLVDVISFHHGDPRSYRGRPAGFYEILHGAKSVGLIVQKISNVLDSGEVMALGQSKSYSHSYRKTIQGLYLNSPVLLRRALLNYMSGVSIKIKPEGKNYRLPSNMTVFIFCFRLLVQKLKRLMYGVFWEKRWNIMVCDDFDFLSKNLLDVSGARSAQIPKKYNFYADPFFSVDGKSILSEALVAKTGLGDIVELNAESLDLKKVLLTGLHYSYPYTFSHSGGEYILPEVAGHSSPYFLELSENPRKIFLQGMENLRVVDSSIVKMGELYFLFCGHQESASDMLYLYCADSIFGPYRPHGMNPVVINPSCSRMGGRLLITDGKLYRFGQDNSGSYGNGICVMEILKIDQDAYEEKEVGQIRFVNAHGPHSIDIYKGRAVVDFYTNKFSLLAGYRRFLAKFHARLSSSAVSKS